MRYSNIPLAHTVVQSCLLREIRQVVISPGSRNAPLIQAFTGNPYFECFSVVDERSAAFFALGLSQQSGLPTALVCTSGSALLNYYPAVCEAFYSRIPLVVLSADRPPYRIDIGDGQTIRQDGVFSRHIGYETQLRQDLTHATAAIRWGGEGPPANAVQQVELQQQVQAFNQDELARALDVASGQRLPVHLNLPFEEPLYGTQEEPPVAVALPPAGIPKTPAPDLGPFRKRWKEARRKMVLVGTLPPGAIAQERLELLAADPSVMVLTETTSNLHHPAFFPSIDALMAPLERSEAVQERFRQLQPEVLLTFGGMVVSKKIKQFLRAFPPAAHWHADPFQAMDTYYCLEQHIPLHPDAFLDGILDPDPPRLAASYRSAWDGYQEACRRRRAAYMEQIPFSDFQAFGHILEHLPGRMLVHLANSSTVRYSQLFEMHQDLAVFCNRGTSGIEGSTSTAVGAAAGYDGPTLLISGDLSFLYDRNGLWNAALRPDFRVIVLNNSGGGIFRILPGMEETEAFETYFETRHGLDARHLCQAHGLEYRSAASEGELLEALDGFYETSPGPRLLEVFTPRTTNNRVLLEYFDYLTSELPQLAKP
ncbi:thiamine pyrophosphate-binding protein [Robiginitalea sp. M366]|uniref:2-succinyl-5-enolpyruvyl-6-hydroxy-3- cyclohexene-1-carboxylate synthase n=1 Tax=Robiginitalea aestuariiviva TaxID=3036903 RepID=UPI00240DD65C|nr:2-succinyl-5-enolpyruvyl-6-hydroxy-3-cyclohexene-1-carboxylate synthase [Robiginitalea aestuariiviva]MDG1573079.1 thiamine pyrophosphate-binding protein [Robiginitalea aestuariiviva]